MNPTLPAVALYPFRLLLPRDQVEELVGKGWSLAEAARRLEIVVGDMLAAKLKEHGE